MRCKGTFGRKEPVSPIWADFGHLPQLPETSVSHDISVISDICHQTRTFCPCDMRHTTLSVYIH